MVKAVLDKVPQPDSQKLHIVVPYSLPIQIDFSSDLKAFFPCPEGENADAWNKHLDELFPEIFKLDKKPADYALIRGARFTKPEELDALVQALVEFKKAKEAEGCEVTIEFVVTDRLQRFNYEYFLKFLYKLFAKKPEFQESDIPKMAEALAVKTGAKFMDRIRARIKEKTGVDLETAQQPGSAEVASRVDQALQGWRLRGWPVLPEELQTIFDQCKAQVAEMNLAAVSKRLDDFTQDALQKLQKTFWPNIRSVLDVHFLSETVNSSPQWLTEVESMISAASLSYLLEEWLITLTFNDPAAVTYNLYPWSQKAGVGKKKVAASEQKNAALYQDFEALQLRYQTLLGSWSESKLPTSLEVHYEQEKSHSKPPTPKSSSPVEELLKAQTEAFTELATQMRRAVEVRDAQLMVLQAQVAALTAVVASVAPAAATTTTTVATTHRRNKSDDAAAGNSMGGLPQKLGSPIAGSRKRSATPTSGAPRKNSDAYNKPPFRPSGPSSAPH